MIPGISGFATTLREAAPREWELPEITPGFFAPAATPGHYDRRVAAAAKQVPAEHARTARESY